MTKSHRSIQITVDICGHLIPSSNRGAVNRLDTPQQSAPSHKRKAVTYRDYSYDSIDGAEGGIQNNPNSFSKLLFLL